MDNLGSSSAGKAAPVFVTTRWSVVLAAGQADTALAREALARLCQTYWYPLYAYARRRGQSRHDAQDLTQEFFARLLEDNWLARADRERGRFRTFLLTAMKHFMANEWHRANTLKRGGRVPVFSLNDEAAEERYQLEPAEKSTPESLFERNWALGGLALGGFAHAAEANNRLAGEHIRAIQFFHYGERIMRHFLWLNLLWVIPMIAWWRALGRLRHRDVQVRPPRG